MFVRRRRWNSLKLLLWFLFQHPLAITLITGSECKGWLQQLTDKPSNRASLMSHFQSRRDETGQDNKPSPEQVEFVRSVIRKKGEAFVAYSLDDVLERIA